MRGIGGASKVTTLRRIIELKKPKIIAIQEAMTDGERAKEIMGAILKDWRMETIDAEGHSRGLLIAWSPEITFYAKSDYKDALGTELEDPKTGIRFFFLNVYGPFYDRRIYWESLANERALDQENLILVGDLNLTLSTTEVWGQNARSDALANFFISLFEQKKLISLQLICLEHTWKNNRTGDQEISKRMDRFLISKEICQDHLVLKTAMETWGLSDHRPITLSVTIPEEKSPTPFKFNLVWRENEDYREMVKRNWKPLEV